MYFSFWSNWKEKNKRFDNAQSGFVKLVKWLTELDVNLSDTRAVMEATSVYHENLAQFLYDRTYALLFIDSLW